VRKESTRVGRQGMGNVAACRILLLGWGFKVKMKGTTLLEAGSQVPTTLRGHRR